MTRNKNVFWFEVQVTGGAGIGPVGPTVPVSPFKDARKAKGLSGDHIRFGEPKREVRQ